MSDISDRVSYVIENTVKKKSIFAKRLNVSQPFISQVCSGSSSPSDRTISDICREFNVDENWLRTGKGEPFVPLTRDEQIEEFMGDVLRDEEGDFRRHLISVLAQLTTEQWEELEKVMKRIVNGEKEN